MTDYEFEVRTVKCRAKAQAQWQHHYQNLLALRSYQQLQQLTANRNPRPILAQVEQSMWASLFEANYELDLAQEST